MASEVGICNRALQKLGAKRITSLTENSVNARACNTAYEAVRDALYEDHDWVFAIKRFEIAEDATAPDWGKAHAYTLPSDFIRLSNDYPEDNLNSKDWEIEGQKIYTDDTSPIYIRYVARITDPNVMSSLFREYFATVLAFELCEEITQSNTKKAQLEKDVRMLEMKAKKSNAFQRIAQTPPEDEWITVRD